MNDRKSIEEAQRELLGRIQTEGVQAAYEAALSVCQDAKAPAPARATAAATLFRVAGYFERSDIGADKPHHEMTGEELQAATEQALRSMRAKKAPSLPKVFD